MDQHLYARKSYIVNYPEGDRSLERATIEFPQSDDDRYHVVKADDTLISLAYQYYGSSQYWFMIADANQQELENPFDLIVGTSIRVPATNSITSI